METKELRIGNLIKKNDDVCVLASINTDETIRIFNEDRTDTYGCFAFRLFNPIPITKEWYDKFQKQLIQLGVEYTHSEITNRLFIYFSNFTFQFKYVHQLQNLYFALTEEELELEEKGYNNIPNYQNPPLPPKHQEPRTIKENEQPKKP